ncbi:murein biosynthesis integral membrane protein MurJ [Verrucomicrobiales bacterium]|nr:murein biosynthesis integral membrane protein MurJ [Verrucomicrobiales bacterium]MDF1789805.1 murein biosynthesis integral membrane protein MurJ [Verrucomicrobiales bacterium]
MAQLRSLATVSGFTAISRVLGFLRDMLIARFVGANLITDAFFTAFRFPNMFRRIFGEGAFNAAFVPLFAKKLENDGKKEAIAFGSHTFSMLALVLGVGTVIAIPCMGWIMSLVAPGFKAKFDSGWVDPGQAAIVAEEAIKVEGVNEVYLVYDVRGEQVPELAFGQADLVKKSGERVSLMSVADKENADSQSLRLTERGEIRFTLPAQHDFVTLQLKGMLEAVEGESQAKLQVYRNDPGTFPLTVTLARITFIYLLCMALAAHLSGVLNTVRIFGMPAAAPIMLNVIFIIGLVIFVPMLGYPGHVLAWCVFVAGFVQLAALWWTCRKHGYGIRLLKPKISPEMKRLFLLMGPGILSAGIQQINLLIGGIIATHQSNAVSYLYYSERIYQLPLGMVGIAFGVVLLPEITRALRANKPDKALDSLNRGVEYSLLITLPAAIALIVIAMPIISGVFQWGSNFTKWETLATAPALSAFAIGLPGYVLVKVLQPGYFAREDTKTPMYIAGATVLTNIVFSLILFSLLRSREMGHVGIALATSIAAWVNVALLAIGLRRRGYLKIDPRLKDRIWRIVVSSVLMGSLLMLLYQAVEINFLAAGGPMRLVYLTALIVVGLGSYAASVVTLGATSRAELRQGFRRG